MKDKPHFADIAADDCPADIPKSKGNAVFAGAWSYPASGDTPPLLKVRYDRPNGEKDMLWYRAVAGDCWESGLDGHKPPLYGLHTIQPGKPVLIVEGEKAAAALHSIDIVAVGLPGASSADKIDLSPLDGQTIALWPDNDPAGAKAMDTISARLARAHKRVDLALLDLPPKGDAADLILAGIDPPTLRGRLNAALVNVAGPPPPEPIIKTLPENWQAIGSRPRQFVFTEARVPTTCTTLLSAGGGSGKSTMLLALAASVCTGKTVLDHWNPTQQGRVAIVSSEDDIEEIARRLLRLFDALHFDETDNDALCENLLLHCSPTFSAATADNNEIVATDDLKRLADELAGNPPKLIIMDPLSGIIPGLDENDNPTAKRVVGILDSTLQHTGAGLILATHTSKTGRVTGDSARGAGGWSDASRQAWSLRPLDGNEKKKATGDPSRYVCLQCLKSNYGPKHGNRFFGWAEKPAGALQSVDWDYMEQAIEEGKRDQLSVALLQVLAEFDDITKTEILSRASSIEGTKRGGRFRERVSDLINAKVSVRMLEPILTDLMYEGRITADSKPGQRNSLRLACPGEQEG